MAECHDNAAALPPTEETTQLGRKLVAIVGPPNSGKSTLFNRLTGLRQKVANFPGVTVEHHTGQVKLGPGRDVYVIDLPGIYSLTPRSEDERVTHDVLLGQMPGVQKPDAVLLILDSTNLSRHLVMAAPVLALGLPTMVVLNMADDLQSRGGNADAAALSKEIGADVVLASATKGDGVGRILQFLDRQTAESDAKPQFARVELPVLNGIAAYRQWAIKAGHQAEYRAPAPPLWTRRLDRVFLHPVWGIAIFAVVVVAVFQLIFSGAKPIMDGMQATIDSFAVWVGTQLPNPMLQSLVAQGILKGVGQVVVFLPQILILFFFIGVLEDSGYLARAALIADRTMTKFGLQGKSFIPLLSAYACAVPAIMATRTIENKRDRIATILIAPFMTCSARLPIYTLVIAAFIPDRPVLGPLLGTQALAMLSLYVIGFLAAVTTAKLLKSTILQAKGTSFLLEMPPYRWPTGRSIGLRLFERSRVFLRRAGTVILGVAVAIWILTYFPMHDGKPAELADSIAGHVGRAMEPLIRPLGFNWKIGIGLLTSLAAREVIVGTLGTIYGLEGEEGLQQAIKGDLTLGGAMALLVFFAFAMQCMSTIAVVRRETGGWRWPAVQFVYMTCFAYVASFAVNRLVTAFFGA